MTLVVDVAHRQGRFGLDAAFESAGRLTAFYGPSGSGKTTLVDLIAGLLRPARGRIEIDGTVLVDTERRIFLPPHRRRLGYVFQDARLFPHLDVRGNLGYGRFYTPRGERYADFAKIVDMLGIGHLLGRRPVTLSGGEKQRVAIGRALLASPRLILMDEPLASLDNARKAEIMPYIERLRDELGIPIVLVSHAISEVARLATDAVWLEAGKVVACGPAANVLSSIGSAPTAGESPFAFVALTVTAIEEDGLAVLESSAGTWRLPGDGLAVGQRVRAKIDASDVIVATAPPAHISALNIVSARVTAIRPSAPGRVLLELSSGSDRLSATLTTRSVANLGLEAGREVHAVVKTVALDRFGIPA